MLKRCCVGVSLAALLLAFGGIAWSATKPAKPGPAIKTGTLVDAGVESLNLADEAVKTKVIDALKAWTDKAATAKVDLKKQTDAVDEKIKAEKAKGKDADKAVLKQLNDDRAKLKGPTEADNYKSARDALKDILTPEQLTKVDDGAHAKMVVTATKTFETNVSKWADKDVKLNDDQKAKVDAVKAKIKDEVAKPETGISNIDAVNVGNKMTTEAKATLPQDLQDKLGAKHPASASDHPKSGKL